jgi:hypothetical protein
MDDNLSLLLTCFAINLLAIGAVVFVMVVFVFGALPALPLFAMAGGTALILTGIDAARIMGAD